MNVRRLPTKGVFSIAVWSDAERAKVLRLCSWVVKRVVILGRGASGKSTLAVRLGEITGLPVIELDKIFWQPGVVAMPREEWVEVQRRLVAREEWIMDGDLGPNDAVEVRLRAADTVIFLDFSLLRCGWRALRRARERMDFWMWLARYRRESRPFLMRMIAEHASGAEVHVLKDPGAVARFIAGVRGASKMGERVE